MPGSWMMNVLDDLFTSFFLEVLNLLGVFMQGNMSFLKSKFRSVDLLIRLQWSQEVLSEPHVCTSRSSMVLHDTTWSQHMVDNVGGERHCKSKTKDDSSSGCRFHSYLKANISSTVKESKWY